MYPKNVATPPPAPAPSATAPPTLAEDLQPVGLLPLARGSGTNLERSYIKVYEKGASIVLREIRIPSVFAASGWMAYLRWVVLRIGHPFLQCPS